ncbi:MAG TPA: cytochrome c [Terriglobales bacterium]|nr:cytochrome c [Terriglobales bacterium]
MRFLSIAALLLFTSLTVHPQNASRSSRSGAQLFKVYCQKCHSTNQSKSLAPSLYHAMSSKRFLENQMRKIIVDGKDTMPPFGRRLTPTELDKLIEYLKTL